MNSIELAVIFENTPSEKNKEIIQNEIEKFILTIDPHTEIKITTGNGSWWISAFFWVGEQFLGWLSKKGFDSILNESKKKVSQSQKQILINGDQNAAEASTSVTKVSTEESLAYASLFFENIGEFMNVVDKLGEGKKTITFGFYNNSNDCGHVMKYVKENDDISISIIQTDSKDDYSEIVKH
jgi:hypothetical protein